MSGSHHPNWVVKYQPRREQIWTEVETYFANLPPHLLRQGVLLKNNLATFYADTGQFQDILSRNIDHPLLYLHFWLLDDFQFASTTARAGLEKELFLAMLFTFAAVYTRETILDDATNFDKHFLFLEQILTHQADFHLSRLYPGQSDFWDYYQTFWQEYAEAMLWVSSPYEEKPNWPVEAELWPLAGKLAFTKTPLIATAITAGHEAHIPQLCMLMDQLNLVFQIMQDVTNIRRDLMRGHHTYPIIRTMREAGLDPHQTLNPEQLLGALVLTGSIEKIGQECLTRLEHGTALSTSLSLPSFKRYIAVLTARIQEIRELFSIKSKTRNNNPLIDHKPQRPLFAPYVDTLLKVTEMAQGYLLADPTFKESWEVQRRGIFGVAEVTGKAFPTGLIAEILSWHGHDMSKTVDAVFETLQTTGFRYYNLNRMPPDTDDIALLLRLYPYSRQPKAHRKILKTPLHWLQDNIDEAGEIPVWLTPNKFDRDDRLSVVSLWGKSCLAVETNVLLGLIDYDWSRYRPLIIKSAANLFERLADQGLNEVRHYIPLYGLWAAFELICKLSAKPITPTLQHQIDAATTLLLNRLHIEAKRRSISPQEAAFLTAICLSPVLPEPAQSLFNPNWITLLGKKQRYDGSWAGEPLFGTPTRGDLAAWYTSRSVTTVFCYHALKTYLSSSRS